MAYNTDTHFNSYFYHTNNTITALGAVFVVGSPILFQNLIAGGPDINFLSESMMIINDSGASIFISVDGVNDHGEIKTNESLALDKLKIKQIWLRGTAGGEAYRLWAW